MCGESGKGRSGKTYHYYKCVSVKKKRTDCKKKAIKKDFIEEVVIRHTMKTLNDEAAIEAIISMLMDLQERENVNLSLYEQQLRDVERNIENLLDAIQQGIFTQSTKGRLDELENAKEDLEIRIANVKIAKPKLTEEKIKHFLYRFRTLDITKKKHRQLLIDMFINRIYLYDDILVITFNHKDGAETITLEDVETALAEAGFGSDLVHRKDGLEDVNPTARWAVGRWVGPIATLHCAQRRNGNESLPVYARRSLAKGSLPPHIKKPPSHDGGFYHFSFFSSLE